MPWFLLLWTMLLNIQNEEVLFFYREGFIVPESKSAIISQWNDTLYWWGMIENANLFLSFPIQIQHKGWYSVFACRVWSWVLWRSPSTPLPSPLRLSSLRSGSCSRCGSEIRASSCGSLKTRMHSHGMWTTSRNNSPSSHRRNSGLNVRNGHYLQHTDVNES